MARVIVRRPVSLNGISSSTVGAAVWGEGTDQLDPPMELSPVVQAAFAVGARTVVAKGPEYEGSFVLVDDWVELEPKGGRLTAIRFSTYEFQGWMPRV